MLESPYISRIWFWMSVGWSPTATRVIPDKSTRVRLSTFGEKTLNKDELELCCSGFLNLTLFLERILIEHIDIKISLDSRPQIYFICSIRIRSRKWDTFEKLQQLNSNPSVIENKLSNFLSKRENHCQFGCHQVYLNKTSIELIHGPVHTSNIHSICLWSYWGLYFFPYL